MLACMLDSRNRFREFFMRLFIAIEIPEEIKRLMMDAQKKMKDSCVTAGWTRPEGIHLTLKFLGEVAAAKIPELMSAMAGAVQGTAGFHLEITGAGAFPSPRNARVAWIGVRGATDKLAGLQASLDEAVTALGFERDDRSFKPHLTLGRIKQIRSRDAWLKTFDEMKRYRFPALNVQSVSLMKSDLKPSGAEYTEIGRVELK